MERGGGQYSVTARCWVVGAMFPSSIGCRPSKIDDRCVDLRRSMIDVSTFEDQCVDFRGSTIDVPTFEDRLSLCRHSKTDDRCEIVLPHLLETLMV